MTGPGRQTRAGVGPRPYRCVGREFLNLRWFLFAVCCFSLAGAALADSSLDGGQPAAYLKLGAGARALGMGSAQVAVADDAYALAYNPGGLAQVRDFEIGSQTAFLPDGRTLNYLSALRPLRLGANHQLYCYGLSWTNFGFSDPIEERVANTPDPTGTFSDGENALQLGGAGWLLPDRMSMGFDLKLLQQNLGDATASGYGLDLGTLIRAMPGLDVGVMLQDPYTVLSWSTGETDRLPMDLKLGAAYRLGVRGAGALLVSAELEKSLDQGIKDRLGLEWTPAAWSALRLGFDNGALTGGLGLRLGPFSDWSGQLDYGVSTDPTAQNQIGGEMQQRLSLTLFYRIFRPGGPADDF